MHNGYAYLIYKIYTYVKRIIYEGGISQYQGGRDRALKIVDKTMKLSLGQRMVGCGTIVVTSRDCDTPNKELKSVKKPREVKKILDEAVKLERDKYMVRGRDMVGANLHGHGDMGEDNLHSEDFDEMADM